MVTFHLATLLLFQKVCAFQRVKYKMFQCKVQLYVNEHAEILVNSDHEMFQTLSKYYDGNLVNNNDNSHNNKNNNNSNNKNDNDNNNENMIMTTTTRMIMTTRIILTTMGMMKKITNFIGK